MANEGSSKLSALRRDILSAGIYKRTQGKIARQATFYTLAIVVALGSWTLRGYLLGRAGDSVRWVLPLVTLIGGVWLAFRLVNSPRFADFLIAVEAEMAKVSWPSRKELTRSSLVVMFTMFGLAATLFFYDVIWKMLLDFLGVIKTG